MPLAMGGCVDMWGSVCSYVWLSVAMCRYVQPCVAMHAGYVDMCVAVCSYVRTCVAMGGYV